MRSSVRAQACRTARVLLGSAVLLVTGACGSLVGNCDDLGRFGVAVTAVSARADRPLTTPPTVTVTDGAFSEMPLPIARPDGKGFEFPAAFTRSGEYTVQVTAPNFRTWTRSGVRARRAGGCNELQTARVTAHLEPE